MLFITRQNIWIGLVALSHPLDSTILAPAFVFLIVAGFSPELTGAFAVAQLLTGLFLHANVSWRLKWLHKIIIRNFITGITNERNGLDKLFDILTNLGHHIWCLFHAEKSPSTSLWCQ